MKTKSDKVDKLFSKLIRLRDDGLCQRCGQHESEVKLDCSHFFSRRHQATRHDPDNACAHCFTCHQYLGGNPIIFSTWIRSYLGETRYEMLYAKHSTIKKRTKREKEELYQHLKQQFETLQWAKNTGGECNLVAFD